MLSSVFISGRLGDPISKDMRYVEVDRIVPGPTGKYAVDLIPVKSELAPSSLFHTAPKGSTIVIKGRLEADPIKGLIIVDEIDEIAPIPEKKD